MRAGAGRADIRTLGGADDAAAAADVVARCHGRLRAAATYLPDRSADDYRGRIGWLTEHGVVLGLWRDGRLAAFLGGILIDDFRNAGPAFLSPEWANGAADDETSFDDHRALYREIAPGWIDAGARIHALSVFASEGSAAEALSLTGFGRIVVDAAAPTSTVADRSRDRSTDRSTIADVSLRRAVEADAEALAAMNAQLAGHIGASPVFFPDARGADADGWRAWLTEPDAVAFLAEDHTGAVGYIKAQDPQFDVSDSVHDGGCLAINGLYCAPTHRGRGVGAGLVGALAEHGATAGKPLMSVDCETHNLEAYAFWSRYFAPVTWSFERRV